MRGEVSKPGALAVAPPNFCENVIVLVPFPSCAHEQPSLSPSQKHDDVPQ